MGSLYRINTVKIVGLYTDDINKKGEWTRIQIQKGKSIYIIYTKDELKLDQNFITIKTIENTEITIGTRFIIEIDKVNVEYDENGELEEKYWSDKTFKKRW